MGKVKFSIGGVIIEMEQEEVSKAIEAGTVELQSDKLMVKEEGQITYSKEEHETFTTNLANTEYKKGKAAGNEMLIKDARDEYGLSFEGKTIGNFAVALKAKVLEEAKIEPSKKIQELETANEALRGNYTTLEGEFTTFKTGITEKETRSKKDSAIMAMMPENGIIVSNDIALMALKSKAGLDVDDNGIALINGQATQDKLMQDIPISKELVQEQLTALNLIEKPSGGGGGGDDTGGQASSYDNFVKEMAVNNVNEASQEFGIEMNKRIKEGTLKV